MGLEGGKRKQALRAPGVKIIGTAHDEVILEADRDDAPEVEAWAADVMEKEMAKPLPGIPVRVERTICQKN